MASTIQEVPEWVESVHELATTDPVLGGPGGISNAQAVALANRTQYLLQALNTAYELLSVVRPVGEVQFITFPAYNPADYTVTGLGKAGTPAEGWALCNGQNNTTDLRGKFVAGMDPANPEYVHGATGGEAKHALTEAELAAHSHGMQNAGEHSHYFRIPKPDGKIADSGNQRYPLDVGQTQQYATDQAGSHSHTIQQTGSSTPHENRPPFYVLAVRQRIQNSI